MEDQLPSTGQTLETPKYTLRLTFRYKGTDVLLEAGQRVLMLPPPGEPSPILRGPSGFWVELRDADNHVLYQQGVNNPIRYEIEVPEEPQTGAHLWQKIDHPEGIFQLLVPDIPKGQTLVLFSSPPDAFYKPAAELARFRLDVEGLVAEVKP